ncbi:TauD/TfdA dioxygenase family protein [Pusillimonas sp.]|uniref:TauD/TfdA dioxygenase family protein n=1 Tax=Pusillimonas sp. TaxID=3040095 RepID=UPI0029BE367E|nr:TauD/TfdA family dioxygenase [Pusillimonas sp.]MDX3894658.1 TauD/TfdA family dioxygenase [Pusillimonas sp.]
MTSYRTAKSAAAFVDINNRYRHIRPVPQMPNFAAVIEGVDLQRPLPAEVRGELYQALLDFEVLFFPPQALTPEQHLALAEVFGPVSQGAYFPRKHGYEEIEVLENDEIRPPSIDHWHSDLSWLDEPPAGTVIQITELPEVGGNTAWASLSKAFSALSPAFQDYLRTLTATHTWEVSNWRNYLAALGEDALINSIRQFKPVSHPVVRRHEESGKEVLFVNETFTRQINDVSPLESREILRLLTSWVKQSEFIYTHKWQANGIAVWDNRTTQHYALADYWPQRRVNQRVTFDVRSKKRANVNTRGLVAAGRELNEAVYGA